MTKIAINYKNEYFGHLGVSSSFLGLRVFRSSFRFRVYFYHHIGFRVIFVILQVSGVFQSFFQVLGEYFGHFFTIRGSLVIFKHQGYFGKSLGFRGILVIFQVQELFWSLFRFVCTLVIFQDLGVSVIFQVQGIFW